MSAHHDSARSAFRQRYGPWALVTGAAHGLGAAFAAACAARGLDLLLVDIDGAGLTARKQELHAAHGAAVETAVVDLTQPDLLEALDPWLTTREIGLLINNAGRGRVQRFLERPLTDHLQDLYLNARTPLMLSHALAPHMVARGRGGIIFVSSASALAGTAYVAQYAATKAYDLLLAESLHQELAATGVDVLAILPGQTRTPGWESDQPRVLPGVSVLEAPQVAEEALEQLGQRPSWIAGRANRAAYALLARALPRATAARIVSGTVARIFARKLG